MLLASLKDGEFQVVTIFADDVRNEENGKQTFIGTYGPDLVLERSGVATDPTSIYCIVRVYGRPKDIVATPALLKIFLDKQQVGIATGSFSETLANEFKPLADLYVARDVSSKSVILQLIGVVNVPALQQARVLSIKMSCGDVDVDAGSILIRIKESEVPGLASAPADEIERSAS